MKIANTLVITINDFGVPTNTTNPTEQESKRSIFQAIKDDLNDPNGVEVYADTVDTFVLTTTTDYDTCTTRMKQLAGEIVELNRQCWTFEPGVETLTECIRILLAEIDNPGSK